MKQQSWERSSGRHCLIEQMDPGFYKQCCYEHWGYVGLFQWTYLQGRKGDTEVESRLVDTVGEGEGGMNGDRNINQHASGSGTSGSVVRSCSCSPGSPVWCSVMTWRGGMGQQGGSWGRSGCIHNHGWFVLLYGRNQHNIVKMKEKNDEPQSSRLFPFVLMIEIVSTSFELGSWHA